MSDTIVRIENLGKKYRIRHQRSERYIALRDVLADRVARLFRARKPDGQPPAMEDYWALRDVSFEINRGEVIGIIGRNGAGKSTLLKLLSRITEPSTGRIELDGRIASLLEVGTGFHPELTGRENIYLNGAILGMSRAEIRRKFDEIVTFAEVEQFLDTPVKRYSSGMYVRLGFAVAAYVEPDILIVDEVLALGDAQFQQKCIGKMQDVTREGGRTILFVSHNMGLVRSLCTRGLVLQHGRLAFAGRTEDALVEYAHLPIRPTERDFVPSRPSIVHVEVDDAEACCGNLKLEIEFSSPWALAPVVGAVVYNRLGAPVFGFNTRQTRTELRQRARRGIATLRIEDVPLHSGVYSIAIFFGEKEQNYDVIENAAYFNFISPQQLPAGVSADFIGATRVAGSWEFSVLD